MDQDKLEPIAVVGLSFRYPQDAVTADSFWEMLASRRCAMTDVPEGRWNNDAFSHPDKNRRTGYVPRGGHFIKEDIHVFDAPFFSITPAEANAMDPHQRIILEETYKAFESAGIPMTKVRGTPVSVHTSSFADDYRLRTFRDPDDLPKYTATGTEIGMLSNRVSWFYDFHGPSTNLDSACSGSLMAVDHACVTLRNGDASMSVVAAGALVMDPENVISLANMGFLSPDGRCYSFDHRANGYAKGEGVGVVILQRLSDAVQQGNPIRAVIRGTNTNSNGYSPGITRPSQNKQEELIRNTYRKAGLDLKDTEYVEGHGTGTAIGDIAEANGLGAVFGSRPDTDPMIIGCVKSNIGHLEGGAGIAGLIKTILVLESGVIPPNTNFEHCGPKIDPVKLNITFPLQNTPWPTTGLRRASINSFGFGGTNAHAIVDDAYNYCQARGIKARHYTRQSPPSAAELEDPALATSWLHLMKRPAIEQQKLASGHTNGISLQNGALNGSDHHDTNRDSNGNTAAMNGSSNGITEYSGPKTNGYHAGKKHSDPNGDSNHVAPTDYRNFSAGELPTLLVWSAADSDSVDRSAVSLSSHLKRVSQVDMDKSSYIADLAYTLSERRNKLSWRSYTVIRSIEDMSNNQEAISRPIRTKNNPGLCFVFTGQGAQWPQMGRELSAYDVFYKTLQDAEAYLLSIGCKWRLLDELNKDKTSSRVHEAELSQPICTAIQLALVNLLRYFAVSPRLVIGHSSGEIAAAYCTGALSMESAMRVAYHRGRLVSRLADTEKPRGGMMVVRLTKEEVQPYLQQLDKSSGQCQVEIGCYNSGRNLTLTGDKAALGDLKQILDKDSVFSRELRVDVAYHSSYMQDLSSNYIESLKDLTAGPSIDQPAVMLSTVTTSVATQEDLQQGSYWASNLASPVRFADVAQKIKVRAEMGSSISSKMEIPLVDHFLEVGPHAALQGPLQEMVRSNTNSFNIGYSSALKRGSSALDTMLNSLGNLFCIGVDADLMRTQVLGGHEPKPLIDLPGYPFDHSQRYALSGRLDKNYRTRRFRKNELLGTPALDWNARDAVWQNVLRPSELPWLEDHKINGSVLYPGPGMVVMALEAMNQVASHEQPISGFELRNMIFSQSLEIPEEGKRTRFSLRQLKDSPDSWHEFILYRWDSDSYSECCRGEIRVQYTDTSANGEFATEKQAFHSALTTCTNPVPPRRYYHHLQTCGLDYGPSFQRLQSIHYGANSSATASVQLYSAPPLSLDRVATSIVHPTSFDSIWHSIFIILTRGASAQMPTNIPTRVERIWIAKDGLRYPETEVVSVCARSERSGRRTAESAVTVWSKDSGDGGEPLVLMRGLETTTVSDVRASEMLRGREKVCLGVERRVDVTLLDGGALTERFRECQMYMGEGEFFDKLTVFLLEAVRRARGEVGRAPIERLEPHLERYVEWMDKFQEGGALRPSYPSLEHPASFEELAEEVASASALGKLFVEVGLHLDGILRGKVNLRELLFGGGTLVADYYKQVYSDTNFGASVTRYIDLLAHKQPSLKILEIGAGTGGATTTILDALSGEEGRRFSRYTFTDVSPAFFDAAKDKLGPRSNQLDFAIYDIERSPESQGLESGGYDLVVAFSVLHLASDLNVAIAGARKLLRPGGKLIMSEIVRPEILRGSFVWGLFPEWWMSKESDRAANPCVSVSGWNQVFVANGFTEAELHVPDLCNERCHEMSLLIATAVEDVKAPSLPPVSVVYDEQSPLQVETTEILKTKLEASGIDAYSLVPFHDLKSYNPGQNGWTVFFDHETPVLPTIDEQAYEALRAMLLNTTNLLWVTIGEGPASNPGHGIIDGLSRVLKTERSELKMTTLNLSANASSASNHIQKILQLSTQGSLTNYGEDSYIESNGQLEISRLVENKAITGDLAKLQAPPSPSPCPLTQDLRLALEIGFTGSLSTLIFTERGSPQPPPINNSVEIRVLATSLNTSDYLAATGKTSRDWIGSDCAGVITRSSSSAFAAGDKVMALCPGAMQTSVQVHAGLVAKIPDGLDYPTAASIPTAFVLARYALVEIARVREGDVVLVHCAASSVGQAAVRIAGMMGVRVLATVGGERKREMLVSQLGVCKEDVFDTRDSSFARGVGRVLGGRGVDVVLDPFGDERSEASMECLRSTGCFVDISLGGGRRQIVSKADNVSYSRVNLGAVLESRPEILEGSFNSVVELFREGKLLPPANIAKFPASQVRQSFEMLRDSDHIEKPVVEFVEGDMMEIILDPTPYRLLDSNSTYLISGGLGGLGKNIAEWMIQCGARHLILLSRSGPRDTNSQFLAELKQKGINIATPACDVSDESQVQSVLDSCAHMPPIKGCVHAAVVMEDLTFPHTSYSSWRKVTSPKIRGSWNLHTLLPNTLDFFIMLSSMVGVFGNASQASYAAGSTYQDALAHHRRSIGLPATALDLGPVASIGQLAEDEQMRAHVEAPGHFSMLSPEDIHAQLHAAISGTAPPQLVTGILVPQRIRGAGHDVPYWMQRPLFSHLHQISNTEDDPATAAVLATTVTDLPSILSDSTSDADAATAITDALVSKLSRLIAVPVEKLDPHLAMAAFGVDSMVAVDVRTWFAREVQADVAIFDIMGSKALREVARMAAEKSALRGPRVKGEALVMQEPPSIADAPEP